MQLGMAVTAVFTSPSANRFETFEINIESAPKNLNTPKSPKGEFSD